MKRNEIWNKVSGPIINQLKQGATPQKLAQSISFGMVLGIFPMLGATTSLCFLATLAFKLNHVVIQTLNYIIYPMQLLLLIPFFQMGAWLFGKPSVSMSLPVIMDEFKSDLGMAINKWLMVGLRGVAVWIIVAPILYFLIYFIAKWGMIKANEAIAKRKMNV